MTQSSPPPSDGDGNGNGANDALDRSGLNPNVDAEAAGSEPSDDTPPVPQPADAPQPDAHRPDATQPDDRPEEDLGLAADPLRDSPGAGVDDTSSPEAVEPNEPG